MKVPRRRENTGGLKTFLHTSYPMTHDPLAGGFSPPGSEMRPVKKRKPGLLDAAFDASINARRRSARENIKWVPITALGPKRDAQIPKSSLSVRAVDAIDWALARSSALFFGVEKPWPVPLYTSSWNGTFAARSSWTTRSTVVSG